MTPPGSGVAGGGPVDARSHWEKAVRFGETARHDAAAGHWEGVCSSAVLAVIHLADALCLRFHGVRSASQDHFGAVDLVGRLTEFDPDAKDRFLHHLTRLLATKGDVQYSSRRFAGKDAESALRHLDRALEALGPLAREAGWA